MKKKETVKVEQERTISLICDLCGAESPRPGSENWSNEPFGVFRADTIRLEEGFSLPECGRTTVWECDICPTCSRDKLIPWLKSQGVKRESTEVDW